MYSISELRDRRVILLDLPISHFLFLGRDIESQKKLTVGLPHDSCHLFSSRLPYFIVVFCPAKDAITIYAADEAAFSTLPPSTSGNSAGLTED